MEGLDNSQDEIKMEEEPMKEEDATGCRGRDASPDRPDELAKKRRLDGPWAGLSLYSMQPAIWAVLYLVTLSIFTTVERFVQ